MSKVTKDRAKWQEMEREKKGMRRREVDFYNQSSLIPLEVGVQLIRIVSDLSTLYHLVPRRSSLRFCWLNRRRMTHVVTCYSLSQARSFERVIAPDVLIPSSQT